MISGFTQKDLHQQNIQEIISNYYTYDTKGYRINKAGVDTSEYFSLSLDELLFREETGESGFLERDGFYTGKKKDNSTGLFYFNRRWYDPTLGRFITEDPIKDGNNWFSYANQNSLRYTDPTGLRATDEDLVGTKYIYGGKPDNNKGGLDCSGTAEAAIEKAVNILVGERSAHDQATDPNLTVPGNGSRGTLNYYNWGGKGKIDHVSISLGNGSIVNATGGVENNTIDNPGIIEIISGSTFSTKPVNKQVNWRYMLFD